MTQQVEDQDHIPPARQAVPLPPESAVPSDAHPDLPSPYPSDTVGGIMSPPLGVFRPGQTIAAVIEELRTLVTQALLTYGYVVDEEGRLVGVLVMRDLLFSRPDRPVAEIMVKEPFWLHPSWSVVEAMRHALARHYPVYPVCETSGKLIGLLRGERLFAAQAIEISAQPGQMVGVEKEERFSTPLGRSFRSRHPWLQLNLLTGFLAAAVVGIFQETINELVLLAVFLPVLAGQAGNTGSQALAIAIRGLTLGELKERWFARLVAKEASLGVLNGALVGITAGLAMYWYASTQQAASPGLLGVVVALAMLGSCTLSGISGAVIPLGLRAAGADPASAASIILTTITDVISMALFLGLAAWMVH